MERQRTEAKRMLEGLTRVEDKVQDKQEDNNKGRRPSRFHPKNIYFKKRLIFLPVCRREFFYGKFLAAGSHV
jgi:hypothetical protein